MKNNKKYIKFLACLPRAGKTGAVIGAALFAAAAVQAQSAGQNPTPPPSASVAPASPISHRAKEFLKNASQADETEIAMANVAEGKSPNTQVKDLARMMRTDHEQNYAQLQTLAQAHAVTIDSGPDRLNQHEINRLQKANDADFDKEYTKIMLKDHVKCMLRFEAASDLEEQDVRQYAQNTLPVLRHHLKKSEEAARSAGVDESTIDSILKDLPNGDRAVTSR
jgi:putative membrane protein